MNEGGIGNMKETHTDKRDQMGNMRNFQKEAGFRGYFREERW